MQSQARANPLQVLDDTLRGSFTTAETLRAGKVGLDARRAAQLAALLAMIYGACMGLYGAIRGGHASVMQLFASTLKVPLLFGLTLLVTLPSLYVVSALAGSPLRFRQTLRLLLVSLLVAVTLLASLGPVTAFFTLSTESYPFMVLLNVVIFVAAGTVGMTMLYRHVEVLLRRPERQARTAATAEQKGAAATPPPDQPTPPRGGRRRHHHAALQVFIIWTVLFGVIGAQTGWILRPFIGTPDLPFTWFRERDSNVFAGILNALRELFV